MMDPFEILCVVLTTVATSLMVVLVVVRLVAFCATMRGRLGSRGSGTTHADVEEDGHGAGLSAGDLVSLPCHDFKCADDGGAAGECAICLESFEAVDRCRKLPRCEHSFHAECVDLWLRKSSACPVCRADVVVRPPKGEAKAAASLGIVEIARRSSNPALEVVIVTGR